MSLPRVRGVCLHQDGLHRARRRRPQHPLALRLIGVGIVGEGLLTPKLQDIRRQRHTLRISQTPIQINHNAHSSTLFKPR